MGTPGSPADVDLLARDIGSRINEELPNILRQLFRSGQLDRAGGPLHLECSLLSGNRSAGQRANVLKLASIPIATDIGALSGLPTPAAEPEEQSIVQDARPVVSMNRDEPASPARNFRPRVPQDFLQRFDEDPEEDDDDSRPSKRRATGGLTIGRGGPHGDHPRDSSNLVTRRLESNAVRVFPQRKKRPSDNPNLQPSTLDKFISGVWENIFSSVKLDPAEVIEQWQAIEGNGQPKLLVDAESELAARDDSVVSGTFGRMNILARKISQTSRTCRSLEVIVQARWVQAFDDRVVELLLTMTKEKAKKTAISEACLDFNWSEKELRNKMGIWRGYHDIAKAGGWAALVFAGMGLYRFCKYRVSFTDETFQTLKGLKHRFEVAADTLHPRWRSLLAIVGIVEDRKYTGHPHSWVVCGPNNEPLPLATTYHQWDKNFSYNHLEESAIDEDTWGLFDPRTVMPSTEPGARRCGVCGDEQSDDPRLNTCACFPNLYGSKAGPIPVQVYRTPNGKNNGLLACCAFERGTAIGEFVGEITSGLSNLDVMVGQTERAAYQIWQGKQGNHTRFVNHSCQPNSQFERFVWLGTQRIVLVSRGVEAGEEITVDYSDTYWKNLDKECLCNQPRCRYRGRNRHLLTPPEST